ncbi:MAG TPA: hypothetical protein DCF91_02945 [Porphyromonadaceae bacterium]|nr:hypothetical protein [Porphyromonadaceae bacterium]
MISLHKSSKSKTKYTEATTRYYNTDKTSKACSKQNKSDFPILNNLEGRFYHVFTLRIITEIYLKVI